MDRHEIERVALDVIGAALKSEASLDTSRENTPQWDSLKHIEIVFALEDELGIEFSEEEMASLDSVAKIVDRTLKSHAA